MTELFNPPIPELPQIATHRDDLLGRLKLHRVGSMAMRPNDLLAALYLESKQLEATNQPI